MSCVNKVSFFTHSFVNKEAFIRSRAIASGVSNTDKTLHHWSCVPCTGKNHETLLPFNMVTNGRGVVRSARMASIKVFRLAVVEGQKRFSGEKKQIVFWSIDAVRTGPRRHRIPLGPRGVRASLGGGGRIFGGDAKDLRAARSAGDARNPELNRCWCRGLGPPRRAFGGVVGRRRPFIFFVNVNPGCEVSATVGHRFRCFFCCALRSTGQPAGWPPEAPHYSWP